MLLKHGSFFTGIGIMDKAAEEQGFENTFGCDNDIFAQLHFKEHFPKSHLYGDIKLIMEIPKIDILTFGFPCTDASLAGRIKHKNPLAQSRTGLFYEATRLIRQSRPTLFVAENVRQVVSKSGREIFQEISACGYDASWAIIPARKFGASHLRERVFIIGQDTDSDALGRNAHIRILSRVLKEGSRRIKLERQSCNVVGVNIQPEINSSGYGIDYGTAAALYEGFRIAALGNSIYFPIAQAFMSEIKNEFTNSRIN